MHGADNRRTIFFILSYKQTVNRDSLLPVAFTVTMKCIFYSLLLLVSLASAVERDPEEEISPNDEKRRAQERENARILLSETEFADYMVADRLHDAILADDYPSMVALLNKHGSTVLTNSTKRFGHQPFPVLAVIYNRLDMLKEMVSRLVGVEEIIHTNVSHWCHVVGM